MTLNSQGCKSFMRSCRQKNLNQFSADKSKLGLIRLNLVPGYAREFL